ncbi:MAG TPA: hypothetical protein VGH19_02900 [Verrucomicrobiae bacterium]
MNADHQSELRLGAWILRWRVADEIAEVIKVWRFSRDLDYILAVVPFIVRNANDHVMLKLGPAGKAENNDLFNIRKPTEGFLIWIRQVKVEPEFPFRYTVAGGPPLIDGPNIRANPCPAWNELIGMSHEQGVELGEIIPEEIGKESVFSHVR